MAEPWVAVSVRPVAALVKVIEGVATPALKLSEVGMVGAVLLGELAVAVPLQVRVWVPV